VVWEAYFLGPTGILWKGEHNSFKEAMFISSGSGGKLISFVKSV